MDLLTLKNFYEDFELLVDDVENSTRNREDARFLLRFLEKQILKDPILQKAGEDLQRKYDILASRVRVVALEDLLVTEVPHVFSHDIAYGLGDNFGYLLDSIDSYFVRFTTDDQLKQQRRLMVNGLLANKQRFTSESIISTNGEKIAPTIGNWVKYFYIQVGGQDRSSRLKVAEFLSSDPNVTKLSAEEKKKIKNLIDLQEYLRRPLAEISMKAESLVVDMGNGKIAHFEDGDLVYYNEPGPNSNTSVETPSEPKALPDIVEQKPREVRELKPVQVTDTGNVEYVQNGKAPVGRTKPEVPQKKQKQPTSMPIVDKPHPVVKSRVATDTSASTDKNVLETKKEKGKSASDEHALQKTVQPMPVVDDHAKKMPTIIKTQPKPVVQSKPNLVNDAAKQKLEVKKVIDSSQVSQKQVASTFNKKAPIKAEDKKSLANTILERRTQSKDNKKDIQSASVPKQETVAKQQVVKDKQHGKELGKPTVKNSPENESQQTSTKPVDTTNRDVSSKKSEPSKDETLKEKVQRMYLGDSQESTRIERKKDSLVEVAGNDARVVMKHLAQAVQAHSKTDAVASLYRLAELGKLPLLVQDKGVVPNAISQYCRERNDKKTFDAYKSDSQSPAHIPLVVKSLLQGALGLGEGEAARIALHIAEHAKKSGNEALKQVAYFDVSENNFKWN